MNFKTLLQQIVTESVLNEASEGPGAAEKKERAKASTADFKARDAARKRVERSRQVPRDKKPKQELLKDIIIVRTKSGTLQLIFKDSFNESVHERVSQGAVSLGEAEQVTRNENFEQTRASKLLFNDVKEKKKDDKPKKDAKKDEEKEREEVRPQAKDEKKEGKAKRLSKEDVFNNMSQMTPEQLMSMPPDLRNEFFKMTRKPPANSDFDRLSYENLSVDFGLSNISSAPYNQQVLNALVFLAKMKAGASDQEIQTYMALAPDVRDFTKSAFYTARKILSQIGDQCIQNLLTNIETVGKPVNSEGSPDMECGNYKFKVSAGGEISLSTNSFDQSNKNVKGLISSALTQALSNPQIVSSDPKMAAAFQKMQAGKQSFSQVLIPDELVGQIQNNPALLAKLQQAKITSPDGKVVGTIFDENGQLNNLASLAYYTKAWEEGARDLMKGSQNILKKEIIKNVLKTVLRGDNITDPAMAPNHLITANGIFPLTDEYFDNVTKMSSLDVKPAKDPITSSNISNFKPSAAEMLKKFTTIVEAKKKEESGEQDLEKLLVQRDTIEPINIMVNYLTRNSDFLLNASLLPGFKATDLNAVQYNYITIGKKTIKIPVIKGENISQEVLGECAMLMNDLLVESLTNNFVLAKLLQNNLIDDVQASVLIQDGMLTEQTEADYINLKTIYDNIIERLYECPELVMNLARDILVEASKRNYKKEYKNYHGKPKQRKERSKRTTARDKLIRKGKVKKGSKVDVDHKNPLRNGGSNKLNNLRLRDRSENRADNGHKKGEKQNKDWK
jgi:hypothetical protein